ncbi:mitochondrial 2-enoyl thioester reductase [Coemansia sp. RSA 988]|nr:mitochondrial 2-enoyl thioester reductase [Coemansia sp. RSA 988]
MSTRGIQTQSAIYTETGDPQTVMKVIRHSIPDEIGHNQVVLRMLAAPINPSDLNQIEGTYPVKGRFSEINVEGLQTPLKAAVGGNEGVAEVMSMGRNVSGLQTGDWVVPNKAGEYGTWSTHALVEADNIIAIPKEWREDVDAIDVACLKVNPCTAYRLLKDFVQLAPGDFVIQNGANSGVGRAVIQLARHWGFRTINVVRDRPNLSELSHELQGLGADIVISDQQLASSEIKERIKSLGTPIRLGLNCVGGRTTLQMTKLISQGGVLVSYGGMSRQPVTMPTSLLLFKDLCAKGFWMNRWYSACHADAEMKVERNSMWRTILKMTAEGHFATQPLLCKQWLPNMTADQSKSLVSDAVSWNAGAKRAFVFY